MLNRHSSSYPIDMQQHYKELDMQEPIKEIILATDFLESSKDAGSRAIVSGSRL